MGEGLVAGVSTACFYPELTEVAFSYLAQQGVKAVEIFANCALEITPDFLRPLKDKADEEGIKIVALHPYTSGEEGRIFFGLYERRTTESRLFYKKYYKACEVLGTDSLVFHGDRFQTLDNRDYFQRFREVQQDALEYGVHLCLENVWRFRSSTPLLFAQLREALPDTKYVLDVKQATLSGFTPQEFIKTMGGENIHHVHFSDNNRAHACLLPGQGNANLQQLVWDLRKAGFKGALLLELYRNNYETYEELLGGKEYMNELINTPLPSKTH